MNIGIDLGGSHIGVGVVDIDGNIIEKKEIRISKDMRDNMKNFIVENITSSIYEILEKKDLILDDINLIGIGAPGETKNGIIRKMVNLNIENFEIVKELKQNLNFGNIIVKNDGKCAAIAEKIYGSMKTYDDCVFLCLGTGVGGAVFLGGEMLKPKRNSGFEIGHMIIEKNGKLCNCGSKGCFETYCSMKRLKNKLKTITNTEYLQGEEFANYLRKNLKNEKIQSILENYIENLIIGLSNITNIFEPECITIGGGFIHYSDILFDKLVYEFEKRKYLFNKNSIPEIKLAKLGNDAGIIGASIDN